MSTPSACKDGKCLDCRIGDEITACVEALKHSINGAARDAITHKLRSLLHFLSYSSIVNYGITDTAEELLKETITLRSILEKEAKRRKI